MRIATWNVNSIRTRAPRVVDWLVREDIDVLAMQEIKCKPEQFPVEYFLYRPEITYISPVLIYAQYFPGTGCYFYQSSRFFGSIGKRLLQHNMLPGVKRLFCIREMCIIRCSDHHKINSIIAQHLLYSTYYSCLRISSFCFIALALQYAYQLKMIRQDGDKRQMKNFRRNTKPDYSHSYFF